MREWRTDPARIDQPEPYGPAADVPDRSLIIESIDALPCQLRDVVNAVYWERLSVRETARSLGIHRITVERRLSEAFAILRIDIDASGFAPEALLEED